VRQHYGIGECDIVLFFMGWLYHFSGLPELLEEMAKCNRADLAVKLLIVVTATRLRNCSASARSSASKTMWYLPENSRMKKSRIHSCFRHLLAAAHDNAINARHRSD